MPSPSDLRDLSQPQQTDPADPVRAVRTEADRSLAHRASHRGQYAHRVRAVRQSRYGSMYPALCPGLFVLTLVPLARVAFCFLFFIKERDYAYIAFTAYVLAGLIVGVLVGGAG